MNVKKTKGSLHSSHLSASDSGGVIHIRMRTHHQYMWNKWSVWEVASKLKVVNPPTQTLLGGKPSDDSVVKLRLISHLGKGLDFPLWSVRIARWSPVCSSCYTWAKELVSPGYYTSVQP